MERTMYTGLPPGFPEELQRIADQVSAMLPPGVWQRIQDAQRDAQRAAEPYIHELSKNEHLLQACEAAAAQLKAASAVEAERQRVMSVIASLPPRRVDVYVHIVPPSEPDATDA
jgi:hypothetical protein